MSNNREGTQPRHQQKIGLKIYWAWPHPSEQDLVSPSVSLSHQEASTSLSSFSIRRQTEWRLVWRLPESDHRKLTNLITGATALSNSVKLWAVPCRGTQDGHIMMERSDKTWSTGEGNGKPLQYSCLEKPMSSMKRQKDKTVKDELPRLVGARYTTGEQRREWRKKNEETES